MSKANEHSDLIPLVDAARSLREMLGSHRFREVSQTRLARHSRQVMTEMLESNEFLRVQIGPRGMLVIDEDFFDRARNLLDSVEARLDEIDPVLAELRGRFDRLAQRMNEPGSRRATHEALFGEHAPDTLAEHYQPGSTEEPS